MKPDEFTVDFCRDVGWSLVYEDAAGRLRFVFEPGGPPKSMVLCSRPIATNKIVELTEENRARLNLAIERTKKFLESCGYEVEIDK